MFLHYIQWTIGVQAHLRYISFVQVCKCSLTESRPQYTYGPNATTRTPPRVPVGQKKNTMEESQQSQTVLTQQSQQVSTLQPQHILPTQSQQDKRGRKKKTTGGISKSVRSADWTGSNDQGSGSKEDATILIVFVYTAHRIYLKFYYYFIFYWLKNSCYGLWLQLKKRAFLLNITQLIKSNYWFN